MAKYHINKKGVPAVCRAKVGKCPFGDAESHYASVEEAQKAADKEHEKQHNLLASYVEDDDDDYENIDHEKVNEERAATLNEANSLAVDEFRKTLSNTNKEIFELVNEHHVQAPWDALKDYNERRFNNMMNDSGRNPMNFEYYERTDEGEILRNELDAEYYNPKREIIRKYENNEISYDEMKRLNSAADSALEYYKNGIYTIENFNKKMKNHKDWDKLTLNPHMDTGYGNFKKSFNHPSNMNSIINQSVFKSDPPQKDLRSLFKEDPPVEDNRSKFKTDEPKEDLRSLFKEDSPAEDNRSKFKTNELSQAEKDKLRSQFK